MVGAATSMAQRPAYPLLQGVDPMPMFLHLVMVGVWGVTLVAHMRRLFRLACVNQLRNWEDTRVRMGLNRIWWWLGQDEFWRGMRYDCMKALEVSLLIFMLAWGMS
jgi:hypothetical protein